MPPDMADFELEEADGEVEAPVKKKGLPHHLQKRKRKYGKYTP